MYKVTVFIWPTQEILGKDFRVRTYITVRKDMTWKEAKDFRRQFRHSMIVRQGYVPNIAE